MVLLSSRQWRRKKLFANSFGSPPASAPSGFSCFAASDSVIVLTWDPISDPTRLGFSIERSPDGINSWVVLDGSIPPNSTTYVDTGLSQLTTYYYRLRSYNAAGFSPYTAVDSCTTFATIGPADTTFFDGQVMNPGEAPWIAQMWYSGLPTFITGVILDPFTLLTSAAAVNGLSPGLMSWYAGGVLYDGSDAVAATPVNAIVQNVNYAPLPNGTDDIAIVQMGGSGFPFGIYISSMNYGSSDQVTYPDGTILAQFGWLKFSSGTGSLISNLTCSTSVRISVSTANGLGAPHLTTVTTDMIPVSTASTDVYGAFGTGLIANDDVGGNYCVGVCNDFPSVAQPSMAVFTGCFSQQSFIFGIYPYAGYP